MLASYLGWAGVLFAQNYSFTYVSRARNSGSLMRHFKAAIFSNGVWIISQILMLGPFFDYLTGKHGVQLQVVSGLVYTASTVAGSLAAHFVSKKTEKGKSAVGASDLYAQVPKADWERVKKILTDIDAVPEAAGKLVVMNAESAATFEDVLTNWKSTKSMAANAYDCAVGMIPDSTHFMPAATATPAPVTKKPRKNARPKES